MAEMTRLINVAQVRIVDNRNGLSYDMRCDTVEITARDGHGIIVLYSMFRHDGEGGWLEEPLLVGRIAADGPIKVEDPVAVGDGQSWYVRTRKNLDMVIRPYAEDAILVDRQFGSAEVDKTLLRLYHDLRSARYSLIVHERLARSTDVTSSPTLVEMHRKINAVTKNVIKKLEAAIAEKEAAQKGGEQ